MDHILDRRMDGAVSRHSPHVCFARGARSSNDMYRRHRTRRCGGTASGGADRRDTDHVEAPMGSIVDGDAD